MAICASCGKDLVEDASYCSYCGHQVGTVVPTRRPSTLLIVAGAVFGAVAAFLLGYVLSLVAMKVVLAIVGRQLVDSQNMAVLSQAAPRFAGLEYISSHHVNLIGQGRGGLFLSLMLPVRTWTIIPVFAMLVGGWICGLICRPSDKRDMFAVALASAVAYIGLLLYLRPAFAVNANVFTLFNFGGNQLAFPPVLLSASARSLILDAGVLCLVIFFLGNLIGAGTLKWHSVKDFFAGRGILPAWAAGALLAFLTGLLTMAVITIGVASPRLSLPLALLLAPTAAGLSYYLLHVVTIAYTTSTPFGGSIVTASLHSGIREMMKTGEGPLMVLASRPIPSYAWLGLVVPAFALCIGAYIAYRNRERDENPVLFAVKMAMVYAFVMLVSISFVSLRMIAADAAPGGGLIRTAVGVVPSTIQTVLLSLAFGFIFSLVGCMILRVKCSRSSESQISSNEG